VGDAWVKNNDSLILQVPSAAIAGEYNYLFNPAHDDASNVKYDSILPFNYDPRLLK
jgi:RES domain-containing protein